MERKSAINFGIFDYCMFASVLFVSSCISLFLSYKGNKSPEEFLIGNQSLNPFPVALSLLTSVVSAISLLGFSGEVYASGAQVSTIVVGMVLAIIFSLYLLLPTLFPLKIISANEYIELRFKSKRLYFAVFLISLIRNLLLAGISLYAPTMAIVSITKFSISMNIILLGFVCTIYSSFGGIKAVIWTDVFQLSVMVMGLVSLLAVGISQNEGIVETLNIALKGGRLQLFDMNPSPFVRYTFLNTVAYGFFTYIMWYSTGQMSFQRMCSVKSIKNARRMMMYNVCGIILIYFLIFFGGVVVYASYAGCDPMALGIIKKKEEIIPYFVIDKLSFIPGFPGIFVAVITGASLSTLSSMINSTAAWVWRDACLKFDYFKTASTSHSTTINKIISLVIGCVATLLSILLSNAGGVARVMMTVNGTFSGPTFGVFLIGFFLPRCNLKGVWTGFILSSILTTWIGLGGLFYKSPPKMLPFNADECELSNFTFPNVSRIENFISYENDSFEETDVNTSFQASIYQISHTLYVAIGQLLCIFVAVIVSFITGNLDAQDTSPKFVARCIHKFYWTKEELGSLLEDKTEAELDSPNPKTRENNLGNYQEKKNRNDYC